MRALQEHHPLTVLVSATGGSAATYLRKVADRHQALGFGSMATRREKLSRWLNGTTPELTAQLAIADLHGIPAEEVYRRPWPEWLLLADERDVVIWDDEWTPASAVRALEHLGGRVDRRGFMIVSSAGLPTILGHWAAAEPLAAASAAAGQRVGAAVADLLDVRLDTLRRLDDQVGSSQVHQAAAAELRMITRLIKSAVYTNTTGQRLFAAAAEASRICGWTAYDSGRHAAAEKHFVTALRAAATADDPIVAANTLAFWGVQRYSTGDPQGAAQLIDAAHRHSRRAGCARLTAMLHARAARAHARSGDTHASAHAINQAFDVYAQTDDDRAGDPACVYWVNLGELHQLAGSCSLNLHAPKHALKHFQTATAIQNDAYDDEAFPRGAAIYLAREAEARLALNDIDGAVHTAYQAVDHMGGVSSARGTSTLRDLRDRLQQHHKSTVVRGFLQCTT